MLLPVVLAALSAPPAIDFTLPDTHRRPRTRSAYKGELRRSPITDKYEPHHPVWKRLVFRCLVTIPLLIINLVLVSLCIVLIIRFQSWIDRQLKAGRLPCEHSSHSILRTSTSLRCSVDVLDGAVPENLTGIGNDGV